MPHSCTNIHPMHAHACPHAADTLLSMKKNTPGFESQIKSKGGGGEGDHSHHPLPPPPPPLDPTLSNTLGCSGWWWYHRPPSPFPPPPPPPPPAPPLDPTLSNNLGCSGLWWYHRPPLSYCPPTIATSSVPQLIIQILQNPSFRLVWVTDLGSRNFRKGVDYTCDPRLHSSHHAYWQWEKQ